MSRSFIKSTNYDGRILNPLLGVILAVSVVSADRACAWGAAGGKDPYDQQAFKPKKLSKTDKTRMDKLIRDLEKWRKSIPKTNEDARKDNQQHDQWRKDAEQALKDLENKGYDTDPEYEKDVRDIKLSLGEGGTANGGYQPGFPAGPGGTLNTGQ